MLSTVKDLTIIGHLQFNKHLKSYHLKNKAQIPVNFSDSPGSDICPPPPKNHVELHDKTAGAP